jgi:hypothetical protein
MLTVIAAFVIARNPLADDPSISIRAGGRAQRAKGTLLHKNHRLPDHSRNFLSGRPNLRAAHGCDSAGHSPSDLPPARHQIL